MNRPLLGLLLCAAMLVPVAPAAAGAGTGAAAAQQCGPGLQTFGPASETSAIVGASILDGHAYVVSRGQTPPAVTKIDLATREVVDSMRLPPDGEGGWVIEGGWATTVSGGQLYVGTYPLPYVYRVDPALTKATRVADLGATGGFVYSLATAPDGTVYAGTYPDGRVWRYAPGTGAAEPLATPVSGADYVRYLTADADHVYASAYTPGHLVAIRRDDGTVRDLTPDSLEGAAFGPIEVTGDQLVTSAGGNLVVMNKDGSGVRTVAHAGIDALTAADGSVYVTARPSGTVSVYRPGSAGPEPIATPSPGDEHRTLALLDGGKTLFGVGGSGAAWWLNLDTHDFELVDLADAGAPTGPERPQSIAIDQGEATYVGGHWVVTRRDLRSGEQRRLRIPGEPKAMVVRDHLLYAALYPSGKVVELDPATGDVRELVTIGHGQSRPWDMEYDERTGLLLVASAPGTGRLEGALTLVDPRSATARTYLGIIPHQSLMTLSVDNGIAYLGGDVRGGGGVTPVASSATVAAFDLSTRKVRWQHQPLVGNHTFQDLTVQDGVLYGVLKRDSGRWFAMRLSTREILAQGLLDGYGEVQAHRGRIYAATFFGDGRIYRIGPGLETAMPRVSGIDDQWYTNPQLAFEQDSWYAWGLYGHDLARIRLDPLCPPVSIVQGTTLSLR